MQKKLLAIDGNSLIHRAFWALPQMTDGEGRPTNAVYEFFFPCFFGLVETYSPTHIVVAFDKKGPTFRHEMFEQYKAGRKPTPDDLKVQIPMLKDALSMPWHLLRGKRDFRGRRHFGNIIQTARDR